MQQIIISGVGGQGVLYVTRLLAEAALAQGRHILLSETHGMAQRGGNVISHLKVGGKSGPTASQDLPVSHQAAFEFTSPLIRPGRANILLALHPDGIAAHSYYLRPDGRAYCNASDEGKCNFIDATGIASELKSPVSANLVLLGFALGSGELFCLPEEVERLLNSTGGKRMEINLAAFHAGLQRAAEKLSR
ncbi:MAG: 2-oxoacid:acceptor oxidoreductase family protein [Desulforhabdus sp.]|jgi:indolepyruvate ferredoxin oxidoreductase beta subunit|nr:2-oxoacid:acceptor oxidoreductase family protein [Desulforhabdus sp.]